jgi:hypothetical protein
MDLSILARGVKAGSDPFPYVTLDGIVRVVYAGLDSHIHELRFEGSQGWIDADLTVLGRGPETLGNPVPQATFGDVAARVVYVAGEHIHELRLQSGQGWIDADLSAIAGGPRAAGTDPFGHVTQADGHVRVVYGRVDNHIHELRLPPGQGWLDADLFSLAGVPEIGSGDPFAYLTPSDGTVRVVFKDFFSEIHELRLEPNRGWQHADLSSLASQT